MSAQSRKISLSGIVLLLCQTLLASGAGKEKKKKTISEHKRERRELAAAQIRPPSFVKRKRANLAYPSNSCSLINSSRG